LYVDMLESRNNSQILCLFQLYKKAQYQGVHDFNIGSQGGIPPYLLRDKGYPCISWIMTPFQGWKSHYFEVLYNVKHKCGRSIMQNNFKIMKKKNQ
jgi:hypothetical protein